MNYPAGAFQHLLRIDQQANKYIKAHSLATEHYADELRMSAKEGKQIAWMDDRKKWHADTPESFVIDNMPDELLNQAARAWLAGNTEAANALFASACEVGFERGVEFLADLSAERGE